MWLERCSHRRQTVDGRKATPEILVHRLAAVATLDVVRENVATVARRWMDARQHLRSEILPRSTAWQRWLRGLGLSGEGALKKCVADGLDQVRVEACCYGSLAVGVLAVTGNGDQH